MAAQSLTAAQRAALKWQSRPPGPASLWYAVGSVLRSVGTALDSFGAGIQADCATDEKLPIPTTVVKANGKTASIAAADFVAPSANLIGDVQLGSGSSVWYHSTVQGVKLGDLSSIGDQAVVMDSTIGSNVFVGAGSIVTSATLADESSVGLGCKVLEGASLGKGSMLSAGSVLAAKESIPAGQVWAGAPAKFVCNVLPEETDGLLRTNGIISEVAKIHMEEAWKDMALVEEQHDDYKREEHRTEDYISSLPVDPEWKPLPTLGETIEKIGVHDNMFIHK